MTNKIDLASLAAPPTRVSDEGTYQSINQIGQIIQGGAIVNAVFNTAVHLYIDGAGTFAECIDQARKLVDEFNTVKPSVTV